MTILLCSLFSGRNRIYNCYTSLGFVQKVRNAYQTKWLRGQPLSVHRDDERTTLGYFALASLFENFMRTVKPRRINQALSVRRHDERTTVGHGAIWCDKSDPSENISILITFLL